ncbi:MAG: Ig-like domain-containing protein [Gemmatimonadaceae bacterium]
MKRTLGTLSAIAPAVFLISCGDGNLGPNGTRVASVALTPTSADVGIGGTLPLQVTLTDLRGNLLSGRQVIWHSGDTTIAIVTPSGVVTGRTPGSVQIAASSEGRSALAVVTVVPTPVATVAVVPPSLQLNVGAQSSLAVEAYASDGTPLSGRSAVWATSNAAVAAVSEAGVVTAVSAGTADVTATIEGKIGLSRVSVSQVPVAIVSVTPDPVSVIAGQNAQLAFTARDASGNILIGRAPSWATNNAAVASVSSSGVVVGVSPGVATITATVSGVSGSAQVVVSQVPASSVVVSPGTATIVAGGTTLLSATVNDAGGSPLPGRQVSWSSSDNSVAAVSATGLVTGVAAGTATIAATADGKSGSAQVTVSAVAVASVGVSPSPASVTVGGGVQLTATARSSNGTVLTGRQVTWATSNSAVATVSQAGIATGVAPGSATVSATVGGVTGTATVTVTAGSSASLAAVSGNGQSGVANAQLPSSLVVRVTDAAGNGVSGASVTWSVVSGGGTVSPSVVTTDAGGMASVRWTLGPQQGQQSVRASVGTLAPVTFTASAGVGGLAQVTVTPATARLNSLGASVRLQAQATDVAGNVVPGTAFTWSSLATTIATVDATGLVTSLANGSARIVATAGGKADTTTITVQQVVATIAVTPPSASLLTTQTRQLTAAAADSNSRAIAGVSFAWSSSAPAVASVSPAGLVVALAAGSATISATVGAVTGKSTITVALAPVASVTISPNPVPSFKDGKTQQLVAKTFDASGNQLSGRAVFWSSSKPSVATVDQNGLVRGIASGTATVTATSEGKSVTVTVTVQ